MDFNLYEVLLAIHILAAVIWVGGGFTNQLYAFLILRSGEPADAARFAKNSEWIGTRVYLPTSLVLLGAGIWMVIEAGWGFSELWIAIGIAGFAFSVIIGATFLGPESKRLGALIDNQGMDSPEVLARIKRILAISRVELVVLLLVVVNMALKPGT